ncbi:MAG: DUF885 domain-containing protein [Chloroflexi bacterium]|nr:DUF885 domain-containing protein [Chloroflexota bacterium]
MNRLTGPHDAPVNRPADPYVQPADDPYEPFEPYVFDYRPTPITPFEYLLRDFLDEFFLAWPVAATQAGDHRFDNRWPDLSGTGRLARLALLRRWRARFAELADVGLTPEERIDREILLETLDAYRFEVETLRQETWDPLWYVELIGTGLFSLLARPFAPWHHRGEAFVRRLRHLPGVVAAARENLLGMPDRPVSRLHAETALQQLDGIRELIDEAVRVADANRYDEDAFRLPPRFAEVVPGALAALDDLRGFLEHDVLPRATGDGRLGPALFAAKLRHVLASDLTAEELSARARRDARAVRGEMARLARELWPAWMGERAMPEAAEADDTVVRKVLDAIAREHGQPDELLDYCTREVARIERFVRRNQMIGLPREPLEVTWTPAFMRALAGAFLDPPGPLEKGQKSLFWITPPGDDWPPERVESQLREDNDRTLRLLCIHEGIPGHYLQLDWSNRCPSLVRSIFASGTFIEGWAVYVTQSMMDVGYGRRDPALMLTHWKFFLRSIINALLDVGIHAGSMTEEEAMRLMVEEGYQEEQEARAKWLRARLTSAQLSTYYAGQAELWDLELEARRRWAEAHGGSRADVPDPVVVGGYGDVGDFDFRGHLEAVVSHGSPPVRWLRRIVLGELSPAVQA